VPASSRRREHSGLGYPRQHHPFRKGLGPGNASKALALAEPYFPKKVVNLMKVESPPTAVELIKGGKVEEVKFERSE